MATRWLHTATVVSMCLSFSCMRTVHGMKAKKDIFAGYDEKILRHYRNIIIIVETGEEVLYKVEGLGTDSRPMLGAFISALAEECSCILIPATMWDYFLYAKSSDSSTKELLKPGEWDVYKMCFPIDLPNFFGRTEDCFYFFIPTRYKSMLLQPPVSTPDLPSKLKGLPALQNLDDESLRLGLALKGPIEKPLESQGKFLSFLKQDLDVFAYTQDLSHTLGKSLVTCLNELFIFKKANDVFGTELDLPSYNVILFGHGGIARMSDELQSFMLRAQRVGYWPSGKRKPLGKKEQEKIKDEQEKISSQLTSVDSIAGLRSDTYAKVLDFFNGITNVVFTYSCRAAGRHLVLPFVFMPSSAPLSYTLIHGAMFEEPITSSMPRINLPDFSVTSNMSFCEFFNGISDFKKFIEIESQQTPAPPGKNYFALLLNKISGFLSGESAIGKMTNVPWVKLPGSTEWQAVLHMDKTVLIITDAMIAAKKMEKMFTPQPPEKVLHSAQLSGRTSEGITPWVGRPPEMIATREGKWRDWEQKRKQPIQTFGTIDATKKDYIFLQTNTISVPINFGTGIKTLFPLKRPARFFDFDTIYFDTVVSDDTLSNFFNDVLHQQNPLVKIPNGTIFLIKTLICKDNAQKNKRVLHNCIVVFGPDDMKSFDVYFYDNKLLHGAKCKYGVTERVRNMVSFGFTLTEQKISIGTALAQALADNNKNLFSALVQQSPDIQYLFHTAQQGGARALWEQTQASKIPSSVEPIIAQQVARFKDSMRAFF
jgi:hypothetical protein